MTSPEPCAAPNLVQIEFKLIHSSLISSRQAASAAQSWIHGKTGLDLQKAASVAVPPRVTMRRLAVMTSVSIPIELKML